MLLLVEIWEFFNFIGLVCKFCFVELSCEILECWLCLSLCGYSIIECVVELVFIISRIRCLTHCIGWCHFEFCLWLLESFFLVIDYEERFHYHIIPFFVHLVYLFIEALALLLVMQAEEGQLLFGLDYFSLQVCDFQGVKKTSGRRS